MTPLPSTSALTAAIYVAEHDVSPPERFVRYALDMVDSLETAERDEQWWREARPTQGT